jgi:hypothetical protein
MSLPVRMAGKTRSRTYLFARRLESVRVAFVRRFLAVPRQARAVVISRISIITSRPFRPKYRSRQGTSSPETKPCPGPPTRRCQVPSTNTMHPHTFIAPQTFDADSPLRCDLAMIGTEGTFHSSAGDPLARSDHKSPTLSAGFPKAGAANPPCADSGRLTRRLHLCAAILARVRAVPSVVAP